MKILKNKKIWISILVATLIYIFLYFGQNVLIKKDLNDYWYSNESKGGKTIDNSDVVRCNLNILNPEVVFVSDHLLLGEYQELKNYHYEYDFWSKDRSYVGTTGIENIMFSQVVKMAKDNCYQFQKGQKIGEVEWIYSPAETEEEREREEKIIREREERKQKEYEEFMALPQEEREALIKEHEENYIDIDTATDEELNAWVDKQLGR